MISIKHPLALASFALILCILLLHCGGSEQGGSPAEAPDAAAPPKVSVSVERVPREENPGFQTVRRYTSQFYAGEFETLHDQFSDEMKEVIPLEKLRQLHAYVIENYGREIAIIGEDTQTNDQYRAFVRWARYSDHDGVIEIQWILREDDTVAGFFIKPTEPDAGS